MYVNCRRAPLQSCACMLIILTCHYSLRSAWIAVAYAVLRNLCSPRQTAEQSIPAGHFAHMLPNVEICPPRGDERYVPTNGITDGVMLRITDFWTKLQASPLKLDTFLEGSGGANSRTPGYENFRTVLSQHASQLKMTDIRFVSAGESPTQSPAYEIFVGGVATGEATVLTVDVDDKGVGILRIDSGPH